MIDRKPQVGEIWRVRKDYHYVASVRGQACRIAYAYERCSHADFLDRERWSISNTDLEPVTDPAELALAELAFMGLVPKCVSGIGAAVGHTAGLARVNLS